VGCEPLGDGECLFGAEELVVPARTNDDRPAAHPRYVLWRNQQPGRVRPTEEGVPVERREPGPAAPFSTMVEYKAYLEMKPNEATAAWHAAEELHRAAMPPRPQAPPTPKGPAALVRRTVEIHGLTKRPELNGRRGRVLTYNEETGRAGVLLKSLQAFGSVEKTTLALLPANLNAMDDAPSKPEPEDAVTWSRFFEYLGMPHLKPVIWVQYEEKLCDHHAAPLARVRPNLAIRRVVSGHYEVSRESQ
jgi:hypothetical protein